MHNPYHSEDFVREILVSLLIAGEFGNTFPYKPFQKDSK